MRQLLCVFLLLLICTSVHAQQVVATAGATIQTSSGGISYTIGQIAFQTLTGSGITLTQGFQQPRFVVTEIIEQSDCGFTIEAFPNPVTDLVKLSVNTDKVKGLRYVLYDNTGKAIANKRLESIETFISFSGLISTNYILKVFDGKKELKSFTIFKLN